jgi:uncharacterized protein (TIGR02145 family)
MRNLALICVLAACLLGCGVGKSSIKSAPPSISTFTDKRDGRVYKIVKIGSQNWFAENLNYAAEGSVCYENIAGNCAKYGRLYNFSTAKNACPASYHVPSQGEWITLIEYVVGGYVDDGLEKAGKKLKSKTGWKDKGNGTDEYGFSALPGGYGYGDDYLGGYGYGGYWWSTTANDYYTNKVFTLNMQANGMPLNMEIADTTGLLSHSVRCVAD